MNDDRTSHEISCLFGSVMKKINEYCNEVEAELAKYKQEAEKIPHHCGYDWMGKCAFNQHEEHCPATCPKYRKEIDGNETMDNEISK